MQTFNTRVGEHVLQISYDHEFIRDWMARSFWIEEGVHSNPDLRVEIRSGYGVPFVNFDVKIAKTQTTIRYSRADYEVNVNSNYTEASVRVHNELALKHALTNLYSALIVQRNWGLLLHSSCVLEDGVAHLFSGHSGAGKSTAARLSAPRELLSDEATLLKLSPEGIKVFNSPFRSDIMPEENATQVAEMASLHLLHQAPHTKRHIIKKTDAFLQLIDKVFYWEHSPKETEKVFRMLRHLVQEVPVYHLDFEKNDTFWKLISPITVLTSPTDDEGAQVKRAKCDGSIGVEICVQKVKRL